MLNIYIKTIPHKQHRYETVGDWTSELWAVAKGKRKRVDVVKVSDMKNKDYEFCVAAHEFIEQYLCNRDGVKDEDVTAFDIQFEKDRESGLHKPEDDPGDDPKAPYFPQHQFAKKIEKLIIKKLGINWKTYDTFLMNFEG